MFWLCLIKKTYSGRKKAIHKSRSLKYDPSTLCASYFYNLRSSLRWIPITAIGEWQLNNVTKLPYCWTCFDLFKNNNNKNWQMYSEFHIKIRYLIRAYQILTTWIQKILHRISLNRVNLFHFCPQNGGRQTQNKN